MANYRQVDWLLGRRFRTLLTVLSVDEDEARTVRVRVVTPEGDGVYEVPLAELQGLISGGILFED